MGNAVKDAVRISIIIPAYNEHSCIGESLVRLREYCKSAEWTTEILVIDDGSTDGTSAAARNIPTTPPVAMKVLRQPSNQGKGAAVKRGTMEASGQIVVYMDADLSYDLQALNLACDLILANQADVVIGDRTHPQSRSVKPYPWHRKISGVLFSMLIQVFLFREVFDTQCGFKCFSASCARELFPLLTIRGFGFDVELLFLAAKRGKRIRKIPVVLNHSHDSSVRILRDSLPMFLDLFRIRHFYRKGYYDKPCQP
jgi:dolichyl-phosphate beta-glucosyltransferase